MKKDSSFVLFHYLSPVPHTLDLQQPFMQITFGPKIFSASHSLDSM
jgi:hypothetical protein